MKIFIAGGTSGIGLAVAINYLKRGNQVAVCGRNISKLDTECHDTLLHKYELNIYNRIDLEEAVAHFAPEGLDLMLICAGSYSNDSLKEISYDESTEMLKTNIVGCTNAFEVARVAMNNKKGGQIAVIASVSGLIIYPKMTTYSMTKRAIIQIANAYRRALSNFGITVTVIAPGYINTDKLQQINKGDLSKKLYLKDTNYATEKIINAIQKRKKQIIFPNKMKWTIALLNILPKSLINYIMYKKAKWSETN